MQQAEIGIIGGSGLYSMPGLTETQEVAIQTPFGEPSDKLVLGKLEGRKCRISCAAWARPRLLPSEINFRANLFAMKLAGVERIISVSAVGSLKEEHKPTDFVVPDQFIDRTFLRTSTFFGDGIVAHVAFGDPVCGVVANDDRRCMRCGESRRKARRHLCVHGRAAVLHARGVEPVPKLGRGCDRHDESAGGEAGPRGGDLLRDDGDGDRL